MIEADINTNISFGFVLNNYAFKKNTIYSISQKKCICHAALKMHVKNDFA